MTATDANADQTVMMVMMEWMDAIQQDNHRIWQYLLSRDWAKPTLRDCPKGSAKGDRNGNSN